jgi:transitional endoplasmic reticulum ATPase
MGQELGNIVEAVHHAEVVQHGEKIILPTGMEIPKAITVLNERLKYLSQRIELQETFDVFPWDGSKALAEVLKKRFGWASIEGKQSAFGKQPPAMVQMEVAPGVVESIPWGVFNVPNCEATLECDVGTANGRTCFRVSGALLRKDEKYVRGILAELREYLKYNSIYRGQAIKLRLTSDNGRPMAMPEPKFMNVSMVSREQLILSSDVMASVETNLFTPIERIKELRMNGLPVKRGVLLGGAYGTGKTLAAQVASKLAVDNGVTFIYIERASELAQAIKFAQQYQEPAAVVFCEDIDREMSGARDASMDEVLNIVDGLDTKNSNIIVVLTTNNLEGINQAMLRPGRLDAVIEVSPPDAKAVEQLLRYYGGSSIRGDVSLEAAGRELGGCIPAVIEEVVKRAKLAELRLTARGTSISFISEAALLESAKTMKRQLQLLEPKVVDEEPTLREVIAEGVVKAMNGGYSADRSDFVSEIAEAVRERI